MALSPREIIGPDCSWLNHHVVFESTGPVLKVFRRDRHSPAISHNVLHFLWILQNLRQTTARNRFCRFENGIVKVINHLTSQLEHYGLEDRGAKGGSFTVKEDP